MLPKGIVFVTIAIFLSRTSSPGTGAKIESNHDDLVKIVGGYQTYIDIQPSLVSMHENYQHICGGILVRYDWVLTAAHCVSSSQDMTNYSVVAGMNAVDTYSPVYRDKPVPEVDPDLKGLYRDTDPSNPDLVNRRDVFSVYIHKGFTMKAVKHDIALVKLDKSFHWTPKISINERWPYPGVMDHKILPGVPCLAYGYGYKDVNLNITKNGSLFGNWKPRKTKSLSALDTGSNNSADKNKLLNTTPKDYIKLKTTLGSIRVFLEDMSYCLAHEDISNSGYYMNKDTQLCTRMITGGPCYGDSGGPLYCEGYPVGIMSYVSLPCGSKDGYTIVTRLDYYMPWITDTINKPATEIPFNVIRTSSAHKPQVATSVDAMTVAAWVLVMFATHLC